MHGVEGVQIAYGEASLDSIHVQPREDKPEVGHQPVPRKGKAPLKVVIKDREYETSERFWNSIASRFSVSDNIFRYFSHTEVFERITKRVPNDKLRLCYETSGPIPKLMAVSTAGKASLEYDGSLAVMRNQGGSEYDYSNGVLRARFKPASGRDLIKLVGEEFQNSFQVEVPIDGYGRPKAFLELIKQICSNGMMGYSPAFRSEFNTTGGNPLETFERALSGYDNDQGFADMHSRVEASARAFASVSEAQKLYKLLTQTSEGRKELMPLAKLTGDLPVMYGMTNLDAIAEKRQANLPTKCAVFDLLTFATEVSTHKLKPQDRLPLHGYTGTLLTGQFDLEGSKERISDFEQFFTNGSKESAKAMKSRKTG
jgi:hypothetical protein